MSERLDKALVQLQYCDTRTLAQDAIKAGRVSVNGNVITKSSFAIDVEADSIDVTALDLAFVSRAGLKLHDALVAFDIQLDDRVVMDVGASTGGFSDVCLKANAKLIYALDVGHDQLHESLRNHLKIINREGINCRYLTADMFEPQADFACIDVSFISVKQILPSVISTLTGKQEMVILIKPQFEAGKQALNKHGVIRDAKYHRIVLQDMLGIIQKMGLYVHHLKQSAILGRDGNREFVMHVMNVPVNKVFDIFRIVSETKET